MDLTKQRLIGTKSEKIVERERDGKRVFVNEQMEIEIMGKYNFIYVNSFIKQPALINY